MAILDKLDIETENPTEEEVNRMMQEADEDDSGEIEFAEFAILMGKKLAENE